MTIPLPVLGATYRSEQIAEMVGASPARPLAVIRDRVVCGCFSKEHSPNAPFTVLVENTKPERSAAEMLARQGGALPVFLHQVEDRWEYFGEYEFVRFSTEPADIERESQGGRPDLAGVLYLRIAPVEDRPSSDRRP